MTGAADHLYFVQQGHGGPVKIGRSRDPHQRFATLQTANPDPLSLVGIVDGGGYLEDELHRRHLPVRLRGEWFRATKAVGQSIDRLCPGAVFTEHLSMPAVDARSVRRVPPIVVSPKSAAAMLDCSRALIYRLIEQGHLESLRIKGTKSIRIPVSDVYEVAGIDCPPPIVEVSS